MDLSHPKLITYPNLTSNLTQPQPYLLLTNKVRAFGQHIGKTTVSAKDTPGFIVNRLLVPYLMQAMAMVDRQDATVHDIDISMQVQYIHIPCTYTLSMHLHPANTLTLSPHTNTSITTAHDIDISMQLGAGHPMGPLHLADYIGLDTALNIIQGWKTDYPSEPAFIVPQCLAEKVRLH